MLERRPLYEGVDWNNIHWAYHTRGRVALFTRAWIEICKLFDNIFIIQVALFTRAWIEMSAVAKRWMTAFCRPLYEGVDWNPKSILYNTKYLSRPLYEGVDWNVLVCLYQYRCFRRPLYEGVDWNAVWSPCHPRGRKSPSLRGRGLKSVITYSLINYSSRPLYEGVDWNAYRSHCRCVMARRPLYEGVDWNIKPLYILYASI